MTRILYWDIDGTLLSTGRAGVPALEDGVAKAIGIRPALHGMHTSGLTDRMIVRAVLAELGHPPDEEAETVALAAYVAALPARLTEKRGGVLPGVIELLDGLASREDVVSLLLTGNMRGGAHAKLTSYGLVEYFNYFNGCGFGDDGYDRVEIAQGLLERTARRWGAPAANTGVLIGDTPADIACGRALGLRVLAVATGVHPLAELEACGAWWALDRLPTANALIERIDTVPLGRL